MSNYILIDIYVVLANSVYTTAKARTRSNDMSPFVISRI